jgi:hypothetical protein
VYRDFTEKQSFLDPIGDHSWGDAKFFHGARSKIQRPSSSAPTLPGCILLSIGKLLLLKICHESSCLLGMNMK